MRHSKAHARFLATDTQGAGVPHPRFFVQPTTAQQCCNVASASSSCNATSDIGAVHSLTPISMRTLNCEDRCFRWLWM